MIRVDDKLGVRALPHVVPIVNGKAEITMHIVAENC
jgi:hypothetical protein